MLLRFTCRKNDDDIPPIISLALDQKEKAGKIYRHRRNHFTSAVGLAPKTKGNRLVGVDTFKVSSLKKEYPPKGHDIYETDAIRAIWEKHRKTTKYPDKRGTWKPYHKLNPDHLQHTVTADKSAIFRDSKDGQITGVVIRNFSRRDKLLEWVNKVVIENANARKSVRVGMFYMVCLATI